MTTLRDEIYNRVYNYGDINPYENTDEILKLFETRIDSIQPLDDIEYLAGHVGFEDAKNKVKELLK